MSEKSSTPATKVGVLVRVIATGIERRDGDKLFGLASLSLMPQIAGSAGDFARSVSLEDWPEEIECMLPEAHLFVCPVDPNTTGVLQPACNCHGGGIPLRRSANISADHRANAKRLWKSLIAGTDKSLWACLAEALKQSQEGSAFKDIKPGPNGTGTGTDTGPSEDSAPDVFDYPRADAALLYGFQRAREVLRAMQGQKAECRVGNCVINTRGRRLDLGSFSFDHKPWLGMDGPLVQLAQAADSDLSLKSDLKGFPALNDVLKRERAAQEPVYRRKLADKTQKAQEQTKQRSAYLKGDSVESRIAALKAHAATRATSLAPTDCADACGGSADDSAANQLTDQVKSAHSLGSLPDVDPHTGDVITDPTILKQDADQARQRFFSIMAMPSLARLFNLVVDVEFELNDLLKELHLDPGSPDSTGFTEKGAVDHYGGLAGKDQFKKAPDDSLDAHYMFLTSNLGRADYSEGACDPVGGVDPVRVWTLTKFRMRDDRPIAETGHFWPCTREEVDIRLSKGQQGDTTGTAVRDSCAVFQYDGVVDLGVTYCQDDGTRNPRYDIVSLDTIQAVQSDIQSDRRLKQQATADPGDRQPSTDLGVHTRRTGGLAVIDRWRQDQVVSQIATAQTQITQKDQIVLDAEDMTTGYRLDVGLDVSTDQDVDFVWRCLMNRTVRFRTLDGSGDWLEDAINSLYRWGVATHRPELAVERRRRADSASLSIASRLRQNDPGVANVSSKKTVFAEQIMIVWHGDPLGVDCLDPHGVASTDSEGQPSVTETPMGLSMAASDLHLELWYGLENSVESYRPPSLRYGWPYHFGLRPVYLGGIVLPIELAIPRYQLNFNNGSALPSPEHQAGRRFLRHERIEAPFLTIPENIAAATANLKPEEIKKDRARVDTGATCILRTSLTDTGANLGPQSTVRILLPPIMQLDQAALNGVFDDDRVEEIVFTLKDEKGRPVSRKLKRPPDGLKQLDFTGDRNSGVDHAPGGFPHYIYPHRSAGEDPRGPAVFRLGGNAPREIPFYPDPSATYYVIAVRRPRSEDYLDGAIVIPAYSKEVKYPNVLPLAIEIKKMGIRSKPATNISDLFQSDCSELAYADKTGALKGSYGGGLPVRHAVAQLAQGEDFEIEVWCMPSAEELHGKFDIVESIAVLLARDSATEQLAEGQLDQACLNSLRHYFPDLQPASDEQISSDLQVAVKKLVETGAWDGRKPNPLCGPGGMSLPQSVVMDEVATTICKVLSYRPILELAATTRIHAIHAVDKPLAAPVFLDRLQPWQGVRLVRLNDDNFKSLVGDMPVDPLSKIARLRNSPIWDDLSDDGATNAIFDGEIEVDLLTAHDVELRATMVSPASAVFDDVNRGRSPEEKARGAYRPIGWVPSLKAADRWPSLRAEDVERDSRHLFGFTVQADGRVELGAHKAPLLKLHDLADVPISQRKSTMRCFGLLDEQQVAYRANPATLSGPVATAAQASRVQYVQPFRDGLARQLKLELVATSRFNNLFPDAVAMTDRELSSAPVCVWLPATKRPDPLSAKSLRPCFTWTCDPAKIFAANAIGGRSVASVARNCSIRVPFDRPHFTSGEGERVGIVIWPPDLMLSGRTEEIASDKVRRSEQPRDTIRLDDAFSDSDLGPGGEFTTRWGADPIRQGPRPKGWLIPAKAFLDLDNPSATGAELEANVLMPIPRKPDASSGGDKTSINGMQGNDTAGREFMLVSLLTYEPRFDVDYERWYIDVRVDAGDVPEPFIRLGLVRFQKHARPELQVSEPIAEWIQVMQKRTVCVTVEQPDSPRDPMELVVEVSTHAAYDGAAPQFDLDSNEANAPGDAPFMRAYVLQTDTLSGGGSIQSIVAPEDAVNAQSTELLPRRTANGTAWTGTIGLTRDALRGTAGSSYSVYVEEVMAYSSTANPIDAETGAANPTVIESGPRFAAIVPISLPPIAAAAARPVAPKPRKPVPLKSLRQKPLSTEEKYP